MVAQNTHASPLQDHFKASGMPSSSSFKNYSRIQSEVEREGYEVHKENLLLPPPPGKNKLWGTGEKREPPSPCILLTGPLQASGKIGLRSLSPVQSRALPQEQASQDICLKLMTPGEKTSSLHSSTFGLLPVSSGFSDLLSFGEHAEVRNDCNLYPNVFPQGCTAKSASLGVPLSHPKQYRCLSPSTMAEQVESKQSVLNDSNLEESALHTVNDAKRFKCTSVEDDGMALLDPVFPNYEQGFTSYCVINQNSTKACPKSNINNSDGRAHECQTNTRECVATLCGTSITAEYSKTCSANLSKPFNTSIHAQISKAVSTFSNKEPSIPLSLEQPQQQLSSSTQKSPLRSGTYVGDDWGKFLGLSATPIGNDVAHVDAIVFPFQQRFKQLQAFLKQCDNTDQNEFLDVLRSLSAAARSGHAVELETRAIRLSLEEGQEMKRMRLLNVLGRMQGRSLDDSGATPQGPRLPAPGMVTKLKDVS